MYHLDRYIIPIFFIAVALMVFVRRKPLLFSYRWFLLFFIILFVTPMIDVFSRPLNLREFGPLSILVVIIFFMAYYLRGFMIVGADGDDFQKAFNAVLTEGNYEFEQTFLSIKIKQPPLEISVSFQSWPGSGQIRMRNKENKETFNKIIDELKTKKIKTNLTIPTLYLVLGILILVMDIVRY